MLYEIVESETPGNSNDMYFTGTETNEMAGKTNGTGGVYIYKLQNTIHCNGGNMMFYCTILYRH